MDNMEWINKIVHGLTSIKELSKANRHLSHSLKKQIKKSQELQNEVNLLIKEVEYYKMKSKIESFQNIIEEFAKEKMGQ
jgi:hypothetical protein